ncbi:MAG: TolC family protein [Sedimentisphaerales bacterium]|nr:TolC family protein [Sedimentisphaerales bacterium]NLT78437.1 TolC family protein [Planctomycetota bacterium]
MRTEWRKRLPLCRSKWGGLWIGGLCMVLGLAGGCSREQYKAQADEEVYKILEDKWQDGFGQMANYRIQDADPNEVAVLDVVPSGGVLSLAEAVEIATRYSREYQSQKESLYLAALDLTLTRHRYAPQWFGTFDAFYAKNLGREDITAGAEGGVNKTFLLANGLRVTSGLALDWSRFLTGDPQTSLGSVLTSTLAFPILGAGAGLSEWENLTQAERNVLYRIRTFNRYRQTFVVSVISEYYRVLQQREAVSIQEASYARQVESTNQLRMEVEVGQRPAYDLGEAEQRMLTTEQALVSARQRYEQTLDTFKVRLALPTDANIELDPNELTALADIGISEPEYTEVEAIELALDRRLDLSNTRDGLDDAQRKLELAAKGLGVQLNLIGSANVASEPETKFASLQFDEGNYRLGLEGDLPLDRKAERNAYRESLITLQQRQRSYEEQVDEIKLGVRQGYRDLAETAESYRIQQIGLNLARKRVEVEKLSLQYGRGTVRLLLDSEDALVRAQNDVLSALVDHTIAKMSFFRDIGVLQVRPDGMWEHTAP